MDDIVKQVKLDGCYCIQLGADGSFISPTNGSISLFINDQDYGDNVGIILVLFESLDDPLTDGSEWPVDASLASNPGPTLIAQAVYIVTAPGNWFYNAVDDCTADGDDNGSTSALPCPGLQLHSLVGELCIDDFEGRVLNASTVQYEWNATDNQWHKFSNNDPDPLPSLPPGEFDGQIVEIPRFIVIKPDELN